MNTMSNNSTRRLTNKAISFLAFVLILSTTTSVFAQGQYRRALDFDGDGKVDIAVVRRNGAGGPMVWHILNSQTNSHRAQPWGTSVDHREIGAGDTVVPADYDADAKGDIAVARQTPAGLYWYILRSSDGALQTHLFGLGDNRDTPMPGDYDGDAKADIAVMRATGLFGITSVTFYILQSSNDQLRTQVIPLNLSAVDNVFLVKPVQGNYDGDNKADPSILVNTVPTGGGLPVWHYISILSTDGSYSKRPWGAGFDETFVPGDYDGDGKTDLAVVRRTGILTWYILNSQTGTVTAVQFGNESLFHIVAQADYDGDGKVDIAVYDNRQGIYYIRQSSQNNALKIVQWGGNDLASRDRPARLASIVRGGSGEQ